MTMRSTSFIILDGQAAEAIEFYREALNSELLYKTTYGEGKDADHLPEEWRTRISHAVLQTGENDMMVVDLFPGQPYVIGNQVNICITATQQSEIEAMYNKFREKGQVLFPLQETEFSPCFGIVKDHYNITFQFYMNDTTSSWS
ncbi:3-demethylubiquinone-9 3-methyltransferase [Paenibacillus swuensis]|uniref:3-demethylubiquinone-9 3-methyltransferase n=1 Tax=Paenibacillus swuensis TaxID=1178515 RepID=A0A172THE7_9BACL|nr:VOC family protein [Paenibacillus swuensis]ANE46440.1 3-demethylubiquinone-9 3-methyltransferase [Paenibacillus swuensis]